MSFLILHQAVEPWSRYLIADTNNRVRDQDEFKDYSGKEMEYKTDHIRLFDEAKLVTLHHAFRVKAYIVVTSTSELLRSSTTQTLSGHTVARPMAPLSPSF